MEQNRKSRNKPIHLWSKEPRMCNGEKRVSSIKGPGKTGESHAKYATGPLSYAIHKINKMD